MTALESRLEWKLDLGGIKGAHDGFTSINICRPCDMLHDLNEFPYPFEDNSASEIIMEQTFEHLDNPLKVISELYRICKPNAAIRITVPYWRDDMGRHPWHTHIFRPEWFLNLNRSYIKSTMRKHQMEHWIPFNFEVSCSWLRGRIRFWKKYLLIVNLRAVKE